MGKYPEIWFRALAAVGMRTHLHNASASLTQTAKGTHVEDEEAPEGEAVGLRIKLSFLAMCNPAPPSRSFRAPFLGGEERVWRGDRVTLR